MKPLAIVLALSLLVPAPRGLAAGGDSGEAARWLADYLRLDTVNPPGNEQRGAAFLADLLHAEGIPTRLLVTPEGRTSLYARLESAHPSSGALVLLHHIDVVPPGDGWTTDPLAGRLADGKLWGRGAIDDKSLGIAHLAAFLDLKRHPEPLGRDVIFLAVADEEAGGGRGTAWLLEHHPELFAGVDAVLGEGGGNRAARGRIRWWGLEVAQKRPLWLRAVAHGRKGHGASLDLHTAPHRLIRALERLIDRPLDYRVSPEARRYFAAVAPLESRYLRDLFTHLDEAIGPDGPRRPLPPGLPNFLLDSLQVNVLTAGSRLNSIPGEASALIDVRLLPDTDDERLLTELRQRAGDDVELEVLLASPRVAPSPEDHAVYRTLAGILAEQAPVVPTFIPGITDSRFFRARQIAAYGFSPFVLDAEELRGIHGSDEAIPLAVFERGVALMRRAVRACARP